MVTLNGDLVIFSHRSLQELCMVVMVVLCGGRFLKCAPIGRTAAGPHPHLSLDPTHHGAQTKYYDGHLGFLVGLRHQACRPLLIIHCLGLLRQISIDFVWVECYSR